MPFISGIAGPASHSRIYWDTGITASVVKKCVSIRKSHLRTVFIQLSMHKNYLKILPLLFFFLSFFTGFSQSTTTDIAIIPAPAKIIKKAGTIPLGNISVKTSGFNASPANLIAFCEKELFAGTPAKINAGTLNLQLKLDQGLSLPQEGYRLSIDESGIRIAGKTEKGIFYGIQSLIQLTPPEDGPQVLPILEIEDYPRYSYRGLHLDVGRHMFPVSFIKSYIDLLSQYKLNTFHWHLTEDQGWRIEIKKYPKLTEVGGYREQTNIGHRKNGQFDSIPYGGYYTQEEVKEVVAHAASRYVTVIPEIEMPGHSLAALSAYPNLGCGQNPGPYKAAQNWGVFHDVYCAGKEDTFRFLENVLDEVLALFPSTYIHIGGDECPKTKWKTCEYCQKRIKKEKLKDEHELQSYFIHRIEKYLNKKGRQIIGWDEILEGGLAPNATVMSWRGTKGGIAAAKQNHDVVMTPSSFLYLDHAASKAKEEPLTIGHNLPLKKVYSYNPTPTELTPEQQKHIIGVQANVWTEYMKTPEKVTYMIFPRVFALSEIAWTALENKNWEDFSENRVPVHLAKLDQQGVRFRVPEPIGPKDTTITASQYTLVCKTPVKGAKIHYTLDGYDPNDFDQVYEKPITIKVPAGEERVIKSVVITASGKRSVVVTTRIKNNGSAVSAGG